MFRITILFFLSPFLWCCSNHCLYDEVLKSAGDNRSELEAVMNHYRTVDKNKQKLSAAFFLIENMAGHYSYANQEILQYYEYAARILANTSLSPEQQRDSMLEITDNKYNVISNKTTPDAQIIKARYLIDNIDKSYAQWTTCPWASQLSFEDYLEWLLPYKATEFQELDYWRDTLIAHFGNGLKNPVKNDVEYNTTLGVADMLRNDTYQGLNRHGLYTCAGLPLLSAYLQAHQTYGNVSDYALTAVLVFRSAGVPAILDETPVGPRFSAATKWFVIISDRGDELKSEWDISTMIGGSFFPYERGPKVYRNTYAINKDRWRYTCNAKYIIPFKLGQQDVTSNYFLTSNLIISIDRNNRRKLKDKYVYIASAIRDDTNPWQIVDFGLIKKGKAIFHNMGREVLYKVMGYDGHKLINITQPFILHKDGKIEFLEISDINSPSLDKWKNEAI